MNPESIGPYALFEEIGAGASAVVYLGARSGQGATPVAIKKPHPHLARDPEFQKALVREAALGARIVHANVVQTLDIVIESTATAIVMQYVRGESLDSLARKAWSQGASVPISVAVSVVSGVLRGLSAMHQAVDERGAPLTLVHRDISPHNILVSVDGSSLVSDFGIARAVSRDVTTDRIRGKVAYMAPEQLLGEPLSPCADLFSVGVVLWELLCGRRLFQAGAPYGRLENYAVAPPSEYAPGISSALNKVVLQSLAQDPRARFGSAVAMQEALADAYPIDGDGSVGAWAFALCGERVQARDQLVRQGARGTGVGRAVWTKGAGLVGALAVVGGGIAAWLGGDGARVTARGQDLVVASAPPEDAATSAPSLSPVPAPSLNPVVRGPLPRNVLPPVSAFPRGKPAPGPTSEKTSVDCVSPTYVDSAGRTHFRRECL